MISEFGIIFLLVTLIISSLSFAKLCLNFVNIDLSSVNNTKISNIIFILILCSFLILTHSFIKSDFSLNVIFNNSNSQLPLLYKITGVWGNHEDQYFCGF